MGRDNELRGQKKDEVKVEHDNQNSASDSLRRSENKEKKVNQVDRGDQIKFQRNRKAVFEPFNKKK